MSEIRYLWFVYYIDSTNRARSGYYSSIFDTEPKFIKSLKITWERKGIKGNTVYRTEKKEGFEELL